MSINRAVTPEEDEELRRLHWFETNGCELSDERRLLKASIRSRDRRSGIRIPRQLSHFEPAVVPEQDQTD